LNHQSRFGDLARAWSELESKCAATSLSLCSMWCFHYLSSYAYDAFQVFSTKTARGLWFGSKEKWACLAMHHPLFFHILSF